MALDTGLRIREAFERLGTVALPLPRLQQALAEQDEARAPTCAELETYVRRQPESFLLLEAAPAPWSPAVGAPERDAFARALAELPGAPRRRVACLEATRQVRSGGCAGALEASLAQLCRVAAADPRLRAGLAHALAEADALRGALES